MVQGGKEAKRKTYFVLDRDKSYQVDQWKSDIEVCNVHLWIYMMLIHG